MTCESMIERVSLRAPGFPRWLAEWAGLRAAGWDVVVLVARDSSHAVGLAARVAEAQLSLLAEASA